MNITVRNAYEHNLKHVDIDIPRNKLVVFTGLSGAGKSSLVFDVIYKEAQRQYLESLATYARQRLPKISRPKADEIGGISPAIVIDQKRLGTNPRSTVGTVTEIYTYLRLLFSRFGLPTIGDSTLFSFNSPEGACENCKGIGEELKIDENSLFDWNKSIAEGGIRHSDYKPGGRRTNILIASRLFDTQKPLMQFSRMDLDKLLYSERIVLSDKSQGFVQKYSFEGVVTGILRRRADRRGLSSSVLGRDHKFFKLYPCTICSGSRLNKKARSVLIKNKNIVELINMELDDLFDFIKDINHPLALPIVLKMREMIGSLREIGLGYLSLSRSVRTLSGGESQRVKIARQLGCNLIEMLYILDEPTVGLHPRDIGQMIQLLKKIRDKGNSVLVVEHDPEVIKAADYVVDIGPLAGSKGGEVVFVGKPDKLIKKVKSITGNYLYRHICHPEFISGSLLKKEMLKPLQGKPVQYDKQHNVDLLISNASANNLKNVSVNIPQGMLTAITGVAGSGKSSLIFDCFLLQYPNAIVIDQSPIGVMNRANPATYTGVFDRIRKLFARETGKNIGFFSFNSIGACEKCKGLGFREIDMHFLSSVTLTCTECEGRRYKKEVLTYLYQNKSINEVLEMTISEAILFFNDSEIVRRLKILESVGLDYLELGQSLDTLSGGEAQRVKLASELHKKGNIYVLDEPTTGLHMADIEKLILILRQLVSSGNTVIVIEHNLDLISQADWIIDLGPEGGKKGGEIVVQGRIKDIINCQKSYTGQFLKKYEAYSTH